MALDLSRYILIDEEKIPGRGEDNNILLRDEKYGFACAFDGCGGSGARKYPEFGNKTGACLGAMVVSEALRSWFSDNRLPSSGDMIAEEWTDAIRSALANISEQVSSDGLLTGSMVKEFPTTMAGFLIRQPKKARYKMDLFWCGDSRVYLLDRKGLHQLTRDDLKNSDPMQNLRNDAALTNVISANGRFVLHHAETQRSEPGFMFAASDGAFGYLRTPMHFEALLLSTLVDSESIPDWEERIRNALKPISADDVTIVGFLYGFTIFSDLKQYYTPRLNTFWDHYNPSERYSDERAVELWMDYRDNYETYFEL